MKRRPTGLATCTIREHQLPPDLAALTGQASLPAEAAAVSTAARGLVDRLLGADGGPGGPRARAPLLDGGAAPERVILDSDATPIVVNSELEAARLALAAQQALDGEILARSASATVWLTPAAADDALVLVDAC